MRDSDAVLPQMRTNRRSIVSGGLGAAAVTGLAAVAGSTSPVKAIAHEVTPDAAPPQLGTIRVVGRGTLPLAPDTASLMVGVDVSALALADAQAEAATTMAKILEAIAAQGIPDTAVQTSVFSVYPVRTYDPQTGVPGEVSAFQVTNMVNVRVDDIAALGELLDAVVAAGANNVYGVTFFVADPGKAATEVRELAFRDARAKAAELASAAGLTLGRIIAMSDVGASIGPLYEYAVGAGSGAAGPPIAPGTNTISASIEVVFDVAG